MTKVSSNIGSQWVCACDRSPHCYEHIDVVFNPGHMRACLLCTAVLGHDHLGMVQPDTTLSAWYVPYRVVTRQRGMVAEMQWGGGHRSCRGSSRHCTHRRGVYCRERNDPKLRLASLLLLKFLEVWNFVISGNYQIWNIPRFRKNLVNISSKEKRF